jgi:hypothetical protein
VDLRLNCAAEICCPPAPLAEDGTRPFYNQEAHRSRVGILVDLGVPEELAHKVSKAMVEQGLWFAPQAMADTIRELAFG